MKVIEVVLAGFYAIVATAFSSSATAGAASRGTATVGGTNIDIKCAKDKTANASVSQPNTTVTVTCDKGCTDVPKGGKYIFLDAECTKEGVLSSVCPGATVTAVKDTESEGENKMNVFFPQLPPSAQVVCLKCAADCDAVIAVAAALPQGPQACAVAGSSVTLQIKEAGGSAQFACGTGQTLMPTEATKAYADDCTTEETVKGMTRTSGQAYVTLKVDKPKKRKLCYLCKQSGSTAKTGEEPSPCTIYVEVSGSSRLHSNARFGVAVLCIAATLRST